MEWRAAYESVGRDGTGLRDPGGRGSRSGWVVKASDFFFLIASTSKLAICERRKRHLGAVASRSKAGGPPSFSRRWRDRDGLSRTETNNGIGSLATSTAATLATETEHSRVRFLPDQQVLQESATVRSLAHGRCSAAIEQP